LFNGDYAMYKLIYFPPKSCSFATSLWFKSWSCAEDEMVYACSGAAVRHWHRNIGGPHRIFVTTARLAHKFNEKRTRDDNLRVGNYSLFSYLFFFVYL
jgi:hypothetical protein